MMLTTSRFLAYLGLTGTILDVMGGLYMAYDILGGRNGPLSLITRIATYSLIFGVCYGAALGPVFGITSGLGLGVILALEFHRVSRHQRLYQSSPLRQAPRFSVARGLVFGAAAGAAFGLQFGALFGALCASGLYALSRMGMNPTNDYIAQPRLHISRHKLVASILRGLVVGLAGGLAAWIETANNHSFGFGLVVGGTGGVVSILLTTLSPVIEWRIDNMPERQMLMMGLGMIFCGFFLQSVQYLAVILNLRLGA
jgi:hypothetical protein